MEDMGFDVLMTVDFRKALVGVSSSNTNGRGRQPSPTINLVGKRCVGARVLCTCANLRRRSVRQQLGIIRVQGWKNGLLD
jgi:hypothetical protein